MRRVPSLVLASAAVAALGAGIALGAPGDTTLVSLTSGGTAGTTAADPGAISADGRYVAFTTGAVPQLFVRDRLAGTPTTTLASSNAAGVAADAAVDTEDVSNVLFAISGNGRYVVFASAATNLTLQDTDANKDVFRKDLVTGAVDLISVNSAGVKANQGVFGDPDVSYDGNRVSFGSGTATNLGGGGAVSSVMVRDVSAGTTVLAAQNNVGVEANGTTERSAMSADGRTVAFEAPAGTTNLAPNDTGAANDIFVRNLGAGTTTPASDPTRTTGSSFPDISGDGRFVVLETGEKYDPVNHIAGNNVYRRDMTTAAGFTLVSAINGVDTGGNGGGIRPAISADGSRVSFTSASTDLTGGDTNAVADVYARNVGTKITTRASLASNGITQSATASERSAIGGAGSLVTFVTIDDATHMLAANDTNAVADVLAKELAPTDTTGPAIQITSTTAAAGGFALVVAATDPSGVGSVTANGAALRPGAGATFSGTAPVAAGGSLRLDARDGSGNASTLVVVPAIGPGGLPASLKRPKITQLRAKLVKGKVVVTLRLDTAARVRAQLLRRTVRVFKKAPKRRVVLLSAGKAVTRNLAAGKRTITVKPPKLRRKARYTVRVRATTTAGTTTKTVGITVPAALPPRVKRGG
jgi:hypothetical protein